MYLLIKQTHIERWFKVIAMTEKFSKLTTALSKAQAEFPMIDKNQEVEVKNNAGNLIYKFTYADLTEIIAKTRPSLTKHGISYTQSIKDVQILGVCFFTRLMFEDEYMDTGLIPASQIIKATGMKDVAAIATYGKRLSLSEALGVAADDDMDAPQDKGSTAQPSGGRQAQNQGQGSHNKQNNNSKGPNQNNSNVAPPKMTEDQSETIANLMIKHSLDGAAIENYFMTGFAVKPDAVTAAQADYLIKLLSVDIYSELDLKISAEDLKTKREARNVDPADYIMDDRILAADSIFKGKKLRQIDEKSLKAFIAATDDDLKTNPKSEFFKLIFEANFKAKAFLKSMGV